MSRVVEIQQESIAFWQEMENFEKANAKRARANATRHRRYWKKDTETIGEIKLPKVNRFTFADWQRVTLVQYRDIHGLIESYGGRVKDYQLNDKDDDKGWGIMFFEMGKRHGGRVQTGIKGVESMLASFCKYCKQNGVDTRIEWREDGTKPDGSPKNRPFAIDQDQWHKCEYLPKTFSNFKKVAQKVENEISSSPSIFKKNDTSGRLAELEVELDHQITEVNRRISRVEQAVKGLVQQLNFIEANKIPIKKDADEEVVQED